MGLLSLSCPLTHHPIEAKSLSRMVLSSCGEIALWDGENLSLLLGW